MAKIYQNFNPVDSFPVLTGKNSLKNTPNLVTDPEVGYQPRNTPVGDYIMQPGKVYGKPGYHLVNPKLANIAWLHTTYDPANRAAAYDKADPRARDLSYGCVNCRDEDIAKIYKYFPQGDTLRVLPRNIQQEKKEPYVFGSPEPSGLYKDEELNYQNGGTVMNKKIRIKAAPQYATGGWAQQIGGRLNTSWNQPGFYDKEGQVDVRTTLPKVPRDMANAVLENDEIAMIPTEDGMGVQKAASDSHASGNDHPTVLEEGSMILSDTRSLKEKDPDAQKMFNMPYKKSGYTYAEFGAKPMRVFNKAQKFLNSKEAKADPAKTNTEMLNAQNSTAKLQQAFQLQEMRKQERGIGQPTMEARYGGRMYYDGGFADDTDNPDVYEAPPIIKKPIAPIPTTVTGQRMYPIINPIAARTLTGNNNWQPAEPSGDNIGTVPAPDYPVPYAGNRFTPTAPTAPIDKTKRGKDRGISSGITAANISDAVTAAKLLNIKKDLPWEPAVNVKYPNMILESDQPIRNVLAEQTNQLTNAMYSGSSQVGRAAAQNAQSELLRRSVQAAGEVSNRNVKTYNQFEQLRSQLGTSEEAAKRDRAKRLYDGTIIANQQYTNAMNAGLDVVAKTAAEREEQAAFLHNQNMTNPYYQLDRTGKLRWNSENTRDKYLSEVLAGKTRDTVGTGAYQQLEALMQDGWTRDEAFDLIKKSMGSSTQSVSSDGKGNKKTTNTVKKQYGGYMNKLPKK
jgi:hypothetical protein